MRTKRMTIVFAMVFLLVPTIALGAGAQISALLAPHIQIISSGKNIDVSDNPAIMYNNSTYVPLRAISEAIGYNVRWDGERSRVELTEPDENNVIEKDGIRINDYIAKPNVMKTFDIISGQKNGEIVYTITEELDFKATVTFEVLNYDNKVMTYETIILQETEPGTYKQSFYSDYFRLPYDPEINNLGIYEEQMASDYTCQLRLN
ncbi:stalk domain-containing protein [Desertibacillus haloalkaliphilus]|uniref:stalk domain-containing protein n=1 Tax=Desertibacillus haloalkaliphilus TaxID=1328930 RepID=UPI001C2538D2|nr:stalk domain-containing protein [Desertibacillus haloalkaliphilus]MBU8906220.1 copper amine oxidase N-terminal domain-containing protein [Desertibacillus haloalkaliphilus]